MLQPSKKNEVKKINAGRRGGGRGKGEDEEENIHIYINTRKLSAKLETFLSEFLNKLF